MQPRWLRPWLWLPLTLVVLLSVRDGALPPDPVALAAARYRDNPLAWQLGVLPETLAALGPWGRPQASDAQDRREVEEYFQLVETLASLQRERDGLAAAGKAVAEGEEELRNLDRVRQERASPVARILARQLEAIVESEGISWGLPNPFWKVTPPVHFVFADPPHLLVISPRERIELERQLPLRSSLTSEETEALEQEVEETGVSALVVGLGGFSSYPAAIPSHLSLQATLEATAHEWLHHYLWLRPLGRAYSRSAELRTINETVANLVGQELAAAVLQRFYLQGPPPPEPPPRAHADPQPFSFELFMRETRMQVEALLTEGQIDRAEAYMEGQRQVLVARGYVIRRLNQAYFAFHGAYADSPQAADPLGDALRALRGRSPSLTAFLSTVERITSPEALLTLPSPASATVGSHGS